MSSDLYCLGGGDTRLSTIVRGTRDPHTLFGPSFSTCVRTRGDLGTASTVGTVCLRHSDARIVNGVLGYECTVIRPRSKIRRGGATSFLLSPSVRGYVNGLGPADGWSRHGSI